MSAELEQESGLPAGLATRMQRLAENRTSGSRPFPVLDRAVRRDRMSRFGLVVATAAVVAVVVTGVVEGGVLDRPDPPAPSGPVQEPKTPEDAGYPATTAGSLADDEAWLDALHRRLAKETRNATEIRIVAAGDVTDTARYAVVLNHRPKAGWTRQIWYGPVGAKPKRMTTSGLEESSDSIPTHATFEFTVSGGRGGPRVNGLGDGIEKPLIVISAPRATTASVLTTHRLEADGTFTDEYRDLSPIADGVWAAAVTPGEYLLGDARVDSPGAGGRVNQIDTVRGHNGSGDGFGLLAVAPAGTNPSSLGALGPTLSGEKLSIDLVPVYAAVVERDGRSTAVGLMQAPSGAYRLFGVTDFSAVSSTIAAGPEPGEVMAGVRSSYGTMDHYLVLAPEGATQVRIGDVTADVEDRLAIVDVPTRAGDPLEAEALDGSGAVIAETSPVEAE